TIEDMVGFFGGIKGNFEQGMRDRSTEIYNFATKDAYDANYWGSTMSSFTNDVMNGRSLLFNASDEFQYEVYSGIKSMSVNDWAYAVGYSSPDLLISSGIGYASSISLSTSFSV